MSNDVAGSATFFRELFNFHTVFESDWYVSLRRDTWERAKAHWVRTQTPDGGWSYIDKQQNPTGSMTAGGIRVPTVATSVVISGLWEQQINWMAMMSSTFSCA